MCYSPPPRSSHRSHLGNSPLTWPRLKRSQQVKDEITREKTRQEREKKVSSEAFSFFVGNSILDEGNCCINPLERCHVGRCFYGLRPNSSEYFT